MEERVTARRMPRAMREPPALPTARATTLPRANHALLINPFYAKDPNASFGKHVLTPTLALTSIAASTPHAWTVRYWDENLLQGPPPIDPFPEVVGITVHLTFAARAFELAAFYRQRGAVVVLGGLHVLSRPDECAPHADALALGEGVHVWPEILRDVRAGTLRTRYTGDYRKPYREDPAPRRELLARESFLTTTSLNATRGCHNRCGFCYLSTEGLHMPYHLRDPQQIVDEILADDQPYAVFTDNNLGSRPAYLRELCRALRPVERIWSAAVSLDVTDHPDVVREMALAGCTGVFVGLESLQGENITDQRKKSPRPEDYARRVALFHEHGIQVNAKLRARVRSRPAGYLRTHVRLGRGEPRRVRDVSHPHAVSRHAAVQAVRGRGPAAPPRLDPLRHRACRVPAPAHDGRAARGRLRRLLPAAVLARARSGRGGRMTRRRCCRISRCRTCTSGRIDSGPF